MAVVDFFDRGWRQNAGGAAYVSGDEVWSFDEAGMLSCQIAHALLDTGAARSGKAAVLSPNDPTAWICVLGIWRAGLTWVPLNPANPPLETQRLVGAFDCEVLFFHSALASVVAQVKPELSNVRHYVCIDGDDPSNEAPSLAKWVAGRPQDPPRVHYAMDDVVAITPTGGTTGLPKGVMNTNRSFSVSVAHLMMAFQYKADEPIVNLAAAPMTHASGGLTLPASARGGTVVIIPRPDPVAMLDAIERHHVTELFLPPTVIYRLLEVPGIAERDLSSLRYLMYAAAPMSTKKLRRAMDIFGPVLMECYGQAEAPAAVAFMRPEEHFVDGQPAPDSRLASCGRPYPLISVEIRDDADRPLPAGDRGEICVRGDLVMKGYYNAPEQTAATVVDGWLHTGDIGYLDGDGYLFITDRKKDMIISGGFNVYSSEVEQVLWAHPAVQDCAVFGVPDEDWGEAVKAVVELRPGAEASEHQLVAFCKETLGSVRSPKSIDFATLPRNANGKVLKKELREPFWAGRERRV